MFFASAEEKRGYPSERKWTLVHFLIYGLKDAVNYYDISLI